MLVILRCKFLLLFLSIVEEVEHEKCKEIYLEIHTNPRIELAQQKHFNFKVLTLKSFKRYPGFEDTI